MKIGLITLLSIVFPLFSRAQKIELNGAYQGINIYVQNSRTDSAADFCIEKTLVIRIENTASFGGNSPK